MKKHGNNGFTLIEVMVTVLIVGVLSAVALPSYRDYVLRSRLTEAFAGLGTAQPSAEQFWSNGRTYQNFDEAHGLPKASSNFSYALSGATASAYTITATGTGPTAGFAYTIDQNGTRATTAAPTGWTANASCWSDRRDGSCTQ